MFTIHRLGVFVLGIVVVFLVAVAAVTAQEAALTPQEEAHRDVLHRILEEGLMQEDFELVGELVAEDFIMHSPAGDMDLVSFNAFIQALMASLSDFSIVRDAVIVEGNSAATRTTITGTFDGAAFPSPLGVLEPNGGPVTVPVQTFHVFNDQGVVTEEWASFDLFGMLSQLGAFSSPAS